MNNKKILELASKEYLMNIVKESKILDKKLTFFQKVLLYDKIREMSNLEVLDILGVIKEQRDTESEDEKATKFGASMIAGGYGAKKLLKKGGNMKTIAGGAAIGLGLMFLYRRLTDPCFMRTAKILNPYKRRIAKLECQMRGANVVMNRIKSDLSKCYDAENPEKCRNRIGEELSKWQQKYEDYLVEITKLRKSTHNNEE